MSKKYRKCFKKAVSYMLMVVLCINMVFYSIASTESEIRPNEITTEHGTLEITSDSIIIDGNAYSKAQFTQALQQLKQLPAQQNSPQSNVRSGVDVVIHFLGIGLNGVFAKIAFSIAMAGLLDFVRNITYVLFTDVLPGLSRMVAVEIKDTTSVYIDGVRVGANWVTTEIATYLSANHASIEEVAEGDGEAEIPEKDLKDLPQNARDAYGKYNGAGWKGNIAGQTEGTKAGGKYDNEDGQLPQKDAQGDQIEYKEWDVNNKQPGSNRDGERFVTGSDGSIYYTDSHYGQGTSPTNLPPFVKIK